MKINKQIENHLVERNKSIESLRRKINNEKIGSAKNQYAPVFQLAEEIIKYHKKNDRKLLEIINKLDEINQILEELNYE